MDPCNNNVLSHDIKIRCELSELHCDHKIMSFEVVKFILEMFTYSIFKIEHNVTIFLWNYVENLFMQNDEKIRLGLRKLYFLQRSSSE